MICVYCNCRHQKRYLKSFLSCSFKNGGVKERDFINYFKKQWLSAHKNWYEGAADYTPATNNGLEGFNGVIKSLYTLRSQLPFAEFIEVISKIAKTILTEFESSDRQLLEYPTIPRKLWQESFKWAQNKEIGRAKYDENKFLVQSSSNKNDDFSLEYAQNLLCKAWQNFDQYKKEGFAQIYAVKLNARNWRVMSACTCAHFCKRFVCKHVIGMALRLQLAKCPKNAVPIPIGKKPTRGRKRLASKALLRL